MGLLDSMLGSVVSQALGGGQGGGGQAALIQAVIGMLMGGGNQSGGAAAGGLGGLLEQFQRGGLGDVASSWVSTGQNMPISADQLSNVLGSDVIGQLARSAGMDQGSAAGALSQILPQLIDGLTPNGQLPQQGTDLGSMLPQILGSLLKR
ncbi:MAG: DUF937 domain-containing protein [Sphaerotilus sp.]|nr:DUF937 domain-containing protein [Sphaerotilus sp.]